MIDVTNLLARKLFEEITAETAILGGTILNSTVTFAKDFLHALAHSRGYSLPGFRGRLSSFLKVVVRDRVRVREWPV